MFAGWQISLFNPKGLYTIAHAHLLYQVNMCCNVGLMLVHRLRHWPNSKPALVECLWVADKPFQSKRT